LAVVVDPAECIWQETLEVGGYDFGLDLGDFVDFPKASQVGPFGSATGYVGQNARVALHCPAHVDWRVAW